MLETVLPHVVYMSPQRATCDDCYYLVHLTVEPNDGAIRQTIRCRMYKLNIIDTVRNVNGTHCLHAATSCHM